MTDRQLSTVTLGTYALRVRQGCTQAHGCEREVVQTNCHMTVSSDSKQINSAYFAATYLNLF